MASETLQPIVNLIIKNNLLELTNFIRINTK
jgi:hypothetical protein